jgi:GNAT superfamily N-acetyltransferase
MNYEIIRETDPQGEDIRTLGPGLAEHAQPLFGETKHTNVAYFLKNENGLIRGGVYGNYGDFKWLYIDTLWVADELRGRGYGTKLMKLIETEATQNGARNSYLDTFSFQAPEFYKKIGYTVFGELKEFPQMHSRIFLTKRLD